jgi:hypothetical protein
VLITRISQLVSRSNDQLQLSIYAVSFGLNNTFPMQVLQKIGYSQVNFEHVNHSYINFRDKNARSIVRK